MASRADFYLGYPERCQTKRGSDQFHAWPDPKRFTASLGPPLSDMSNSGVFAGRARYWSSLCWLCSRLWPFNAKTFNSWLFESLTSLTFSLPGHPPSDLCITPQSQLEITWIQCAVGGAEAAGVSAEGSCTPNFCSWCKQTHARFRYLNTDADQTTTFTIFGSRDTSLFSGHSLQLFGLNKLRICSWWNLFNFWVLCCR